MMSVIQAVPIHQFPTAATITAVGGFGKNDEKVKKKKKKPGKWTTKWILFHRH